MRARHGQHSLRLAPAHLGLAVDSHAEGLAGVQALLAGRGEVAGLAGCGPGISCQPNNLESWIQTRS